MVSRREYGLAVLLVAAATAVCFSLSHFLELTNLAMIYLLATLIVAARGNRGPAALSSILGVLCFDFFFVPPRFTLRVSDVQYFWTFVGMFTTAMVISHLAIRLRAEAASARENEQRSVWLLEKAKKAEIEAESERLRSSLLSSVSHDLRTPLAAILGSVGTLLGRGEPVKHPESRELLENIQNEGERLSRLIQNLLEATRLESGAVQLHKELYPLEEVVGSSLERLEKSLDGRDVIVRIPDELPSIPMDAILMEQVFMNLLENGIRYTPPKGRLEIFAEVRDDSVRVSVLDQGPGLKVGESERVFDKFYRGESSKGAGLGLAICRAVINAHGGHISAENRPGGGAAFQFTLPLEKSHER
ncbi:MAG: DUF4118 domain-containing protein [Elusimicrobiota bacterium]|jgi:two-component system sensor histidine kinase KdpD